MPKRSMIVVALLTLAATAAPAQDYPSAPVHLISGFPAGSTADISARVVGAKMGAILGQQFVIENRLGAASSIAGAQAARAAKDGYTLFVSSAANMLDWDDPDFDPHQVDVTALHRNLARLAQFLGNRKASGHGPE